MGEYRGVGLPLGPFSRGADVAYPSLGTTLTAQYSLVGCRDSNPVNPCKVQPCGLRTSTGMQSPVRLFSLLPFMSGRLFSYPAIAFDLAGVLVLGPGIGSMPGSSGATVTSRCACFPGYRGSVGAGASRRAARA